MPISSDDPAVITINLYTPAKQGDPLTARISATLAGEDVTALLTALTAQLAPVTVQKPGEPPAVYLQGSIVANTSLTPGIQLNGPLTLSVTIGPEPPPQEGGA